MKRIKLFIGLAALLGLACSPYVDPNQVMSLLDVNQVNENVALSGAAGGDTFNITSITKDSVDLTGAPTSVTNNGSVPIIITFENGQFGSLGLTIYEITSNTGLRGSAVSITKTDTYPLTPITFEAWVYTSDLATNKTYELVFTAANCQNSLGLGLDTEGDNIGGQTEDDRIYRFSTYSYLEGLRMPAPSTTIPTPSAAAIVGGPARQRSWSTTNNINSPISNASSASFIDKSSVEGSITAYNLATGQSTTVTVSFNPNTNAGNLIVTMPSTMPLGAYKLVFDNQQVKESQAMNLYVHRGDYQDNPGGYFPKTYTFTLSSGNPGPTITGQTSINEFITEVEFSQDTDLATVTATALYIGRYNSTGGSWNYYPIQTTLTYMGNYTYRITSPSTIGDFNVGNDTDNDWRLFINSTLIKSTNGDVMGTGSSILRN